MTLPIDPTTLTEEGIEQQRATLEMDHEEAIEFVRDCCEEANFGIPVECSPSELLNEKVDADRGPYCVLGACHPQMANPTSRRSTTSRLSRRDRPDPRRSFLTSENGTHRVK